MKTVPFLVYRLGNFKIFYKSASKIKVKVTRSDILVCIERSRHNKDTRVKKLLANVFFLFILARLTESRGSYGRTPGVRRRRRWRCRWRRRPHLVKVSLLPLISHITLLYLAYALQ